jgi:hypothetical protein
MKNPRTLFFRSAPAPSIMNSASTTCHGAATGAGIARGDLHGERHDVGVLRDRLCEQRNGADHHRQDGDHIRENRSPDEKIRDHAGRYLPAAAEDGAAAIVCSCGSTFCPEIARRITSTTTPSSGLSPLSITRSSPIGKITAHAQFPA